MTFFGGNDTRFILDLPPQSRFMRPMAVYQGSSPVCELNCYNIQNVCFFPGRLDKNDLNARIGELVKKIEEVKVEVYESLQKKYADFFPNLNTAIDLQKRVKDIQEEMDSTMNKIESEVNHSEIFFQEKQSSTLKISTLQFTSKLRNSYWTYM